MKAVLVDTNALTRLFAGDETVLASLAQAECVYASAIVLGELEAGFRGGSRYARNLALLEAFLAKPSVAVLPVGRETAECFGRIKQSLRTQGTPIPVNDLWVAAQCLETGAVLITFDRHFDRVAGLRVWSAPSPRTATPS